MATDEVPYRTPVPLAFELVQHVGIFFEENLRTSSNLRDASQSFKETRLTFQLLRTRHSSTQSPLQHPCIRHSFLSPSSDSSATASGHRGHHPRSPIHDNTRQIDGRKREPPMHPSASFDLRTHLSVLLMQNLMLPLPLRISNPRGRAYGVRIAQKLVS